MVAWKPGHSGGAKGCGKVETRCPTRRKTNRRPCPKGATRAGAILLRWGRVEPTVWTERMLTALEQGVQGGRRFRLIDKVHPQRDLNAAYFRVAADKGAAGVDLESVTMFEDRLEAELKDLGDALRTGTYRPQAIRRHWIPKTGKPGEAAAGHPDGPRPSGPDGASAGVGTDLRARLRPAELRRSPQTGLQKTHFGGWTSCSKPVTRMSLMPT